MTTRFQGISRSGPRWRAKRGLGAVSALAASLALLAVVPALASGGLPHLSTLQAGPYSVHIYNDSPTLVIGHNVLTLEVPAEAAGRGVLLELIDSGGRSLPVDLQPVSVLGEEDAGGHGAHDAHAGHGVPVAAPVAPAAHDHAAAGHNTAGHAEPAAAAPEPSSVQPAAPVLRRGAVDLPAAGTWKARVMLGGADAELYTAEVSLDAVDGGPNRLYLFALGALMAGAVGFGVVARRRRPATVKAVKGFTGRAS